MGINFDSGHRHDFQDAGNISISKKMHLHDTQGAKGATPSDHIEKADSSAYQEDYIPEAGAPDLPNSDPNASDQMPQRTPRPQYTYLSNLNKQFSNVTPQQMAMLGKNVTPQQAQNMLAFAYNHPDAPVSPAVKQLLTQMESKATAMTQKKYPGFEPQPPNTEAADEQLSAENSSNFNSLALTTPGLTKQQAQALIFCYNNPEYASELPPDQQALLSTLQGQANSETLEQQGLPESSGYQIPVDNTRYNAQINVAYDQNFTKAMNTNPETKNLPPNQKAQLETLHQFPDANVPDKALLEGYLSELNGEAKQATQQEFNFPNDYEPGTCFDDYASEVLGSYESSFEAGVENFSPPLTSSEKQQLLSTNGLSGKNLPPNLQAIFTKIQTTTMSQIAQMYGIPDNWLQGGAEGETIGVDGESEEVDQTSEGGEEESGSVGGTKNQGDRVGLSAFPRVVQKHLKYHHKLKTEGPSNVDILRNRDYTTSKNAIGFFDSGIKHAHKLAKSLNLLNAGWMPAGDYMFTVHRQLDRLRANVYKVEYALAKLSQIEGEMSIDCQQDKNALNWQSIVKSRQHPKVCFLLKIFKACPILLMLIPGAQFFAPLIIAMQVANVVKGPNNALTNFAVKTAFWCVDMVTGGALSAICQAANVQPPGENPLEQVGMLNKSQAAKMDMAVQIIIMVVEIVVEAILCQPEAIMAEIMEFAGEVATEATTEGVAAAAKMVAKAVVKVTVEAGTKAAEGISEAGSKVAQMGAKAAKMIEKAVQDLQEAADDLVQALRKIMREALEEGGEKGGDIAGKGGKLGRAGNRIRELGENTAQELVDRGAAILNKMKSMLGKAIEDAKDSETYLAKLRKLKKAVSTPAGMFRVYMGAQGLISGALYAGAGVLNGINDQEQARMLLREARLHSGITRLTADYNIENKCLGNLLNALQVCASWVNDINQQESQFWNKMQIHFIAA